MFELLSINCYYYFMLFRFRYYELTSILLFISIISIIIIISCYFVLFYFWILHVHRLLCSSDCTNVRERDDQFQFVHVALFD